MRPIDTCRGRQPHVPGAGPRPEPPFADSLGRRRSEARRVPRLAGAPGGRSPVSVEDRLEQLSPARRALVERLMRGRPDEPAAAPARIPRRADPTLHPLSLAQERIWGLERLAPRGPFPNLPPSLPLPGRPDSLR